MTQEQKAKEIKDNAREEMQKEIIERVTEESNTKILIEIIRFLRRTNEEENYEGSFSLYHAFLEQQAEKEGVSYEDFDKMLQEESKIFYKGWTEEDQE